VFVLAPAERPELTAGDYRLGENGWAFSPQGGLRASVRDLDRLAQVFAGRRGAPRLLSRASLDRMQRPEWTYDPTSLNGDTNTGTMRCYGLAVHALTGHTGQQGDALFGPGSEGWRGHLGQAYGLLAGLWWNRDGRTLVFAINGTSLPLLAGRRSAFTAWEESVVAAALAA
jgi:CubicO group peptidase (beta-lactamase class C family)